MIIILLPLLPPLLCPLIAAWVVFVFSKVELEKTTMMLLHLPRMYSSSCPVLSSYTPGTHV